MSNKRLVEVVDDIDDGSQCLNHPYHRSTPGGICAFCLQEKLGKLVSSSNTSTSFPPSPPSPRRPKFPFTIPSTTHKNNISVDGASFLKKSKSVRTDVGSSQRKKSFWSFLHNSTSTSHLNKQLGLAAEDSTAASSSEVAFGRRVGRSRSVGCGSRSFSGDFLERISTGFGDCTLRRVESQRESRLRIGSRVDRESERRVGGGMKCGGFFSGFGMMSMGSGYMMEEIGSVGSSRGGRSKGWGWALASPMRVFRPLGSTKQVCTVNNGVGGGSIESSDSRAGNSIGSRVVADNVAG